MKPSEFYADYQSTTVGVTGLTFTEKWTQPAMSIYVQSQNNFSTEAYYLGWIRYDNLPIIMGHHSVSVDAENDSLVFEDNTVVDNYPCGYLRQNNYYNTQIFVEDGVVISGIGGYTPFMHNDLHPEYSALNGATLRFKYYEKINDEIVPRQSIITDINGANIGFGYNQPNTLKELFDFLNGTSTFTYTVGNYTYDLDASQLTEGYGEFVSNEDESRSILIFLSTIQPYVPRYSRAASSGDFSSAFFATVKYEDSSQEEHSYDVVLANDNLPSLGLGAFYWNDYSFSVLNTIKYSGKVAGEFKISDLTSMSATTGYAISGNIFAYCVYGSGGSNPRTNFSILSNPADMLRTLSLYYRVDFSGTNPPTATYVNGVTYATDVNSDNEFLARLKTGNISDDEFRDGLRYWQSSSITSNDFDEEDVPPYEPEPEPDDEEEIGSPISRPPTLGVGGTLGFVTQYSLTATQVAALGRILWTSFLDPDYYKNFLFSLALDTGSFNMSSLLTYFISLRVYPFPLINVPSHEAAGSSMFVGAGTVPLAFSDTLHTINNYADYIDAGSLVVPRHYNDFRDYTDAEYMLYLPYCGTVQLNPGDVVGNTLSAQYAIDFATGACIAYVDLRTGDGHGYPIAALPGHIGADVPLTATNAGQVAAMLAGDAMHIAQTIGNVPATQISSGVAGFAAADTGNLAGAANSLIRSWTAPVTAAGQYAQHLATMATRPAIGIPMLSGGRGFGAFGAPQTAYLQIRRGLYKQPDNYAHTVGYASTVSKKIGEAQGLITAYVDTSTLTATADEAAEITALLKSGVIL